MRHGHSRWRRPLWPVRPCILPCTRHGLSGHWAAVGTVQDGERHRRPRLLCQRRAARRERRAGQLSSPSLRLRLHLHLQPQPPPPPAPQPRLRLRLRLRLNPASAQPHSQPNAQPSPGESVAEVRRDMPQVLLHDCYVWLPYDLLAFRMIPTHIRPTTTALMTLGWNTYLSAVAVRARAGATPAAATAPVYGSTGGAPTAVRPIRDSDTC